MDFIQKYSLLIHRPPPSQNPSVILMNFRGCTPPRAPPLEARARVGARRLGLPPQRRVRGRGHAPSAFPLKGACAGSPSWALRRGLFTGRSPSWALRCGLSAVGCLLRALHRGLTFVGETSWALRRGLFAGGSPLRALRRGLTCVGSPSWALHRGLSVVGSLLCPPCLVVFFFCSGHGSTGVLDTRSAQYIYTCMHMSTYIYLYVYTGMKPL